MPISLAKFLHPDDSDPKADDAPPRSAPQQGMTLPTQNSPPPAPSAPTLPPTSAGTPAIPGAASQALNLGELKEILGELSSEWKGVVNAIADLKKDLAQESAVAIATPAPRAATPARTAPTTKKPPAGVAPALPKTNTAIAPPSVSQAPLPSLPTRPPTTGPEIDAKLSELLRILKDSVARKGGNAPTMEIPRELTLEIAREVAGRVRESMMESSQQGPTTTASPTDKATAKPTPPKRIPLDDLGAIIDQITTQGP